MTENEVAQRLAQFCKQEGLRIEDATMAMIMITAGVIGLPAKDEGDLLDGIKLINDAVRHYAVKAWERKGRIMGHG